jgi:Rrf2 family protein
MYSEKARWQMRISSKGRYALMSAVCLAGQYKSGSVVTVAAIAEKYNVSKIYLEQVFGTLKRGGIVHSVKGKTGGYLLSKSPAEISVHDVLTAIETVLFERTDETCRASAPELEATLQSKVFDVIDESVNSRLAAISLADLVEEEARRLSSAGANMYYI